MSSPRCIEEWVTKANRCPVCNTHIVDEEQLREQRMAVIEGRLTSSPNNNGQRQRRRRARGENGAFELRNGVFHMADSDVPLEEESDHPLPIRPYADADHTSEPPLAASSQVA